MRFRLIEGLVRDMRKYYEDIPETTFQLLVACDPTNRNMDKDFDNWVAGKYVKWILQKYQKGWFTTDEQQLNNITDMLAEFERLKPHMPSQDINSYKDIDELYDVLDKAKELEQRYIPSDKASMRANKANSSDEDLEIVYQNDSFKVYWPKTYAQAKQVGQGTDWCTASSNDTYFANYNERGPLRAIHLNGKPFAQYHIESGQFLNTNDKSFTWSYFLQNAPIDDVKSLVDFIKSDFNSANDSNLSGNSYDLKEFLDSFPSDSELEKIKVLGVDLGEKLKSELVLIIDEFNTQHFIDWAYEYTNHHASSTRYWQSYARQFAKEELTKYTTFSTYMEYKSFIKATYDGCFGFVDNADVLPVVSSDEIKQFNLSIRDTILHVLLNVFPVAPYLMGIKYDEFHYDIESIYWARDIRATTGYYLPTKLKRIYVRDSNDVFESIPSSLLRSRRYRFIEVDSYEEAIKKEVALQTKIENEKQSTTESLNEKLSDVRALLDRSKRLNNPEVLNQLTSGDYIYNPMTNSFLYIMGKMGDNVKTVPSGSDLTVYHDQRPEVQNQKNLRNYFLLGNRSEINEMESSLIDTLGYDREFDGVKGDLDSIQKWQRSSGYYAYQDKAIDDETGEEFDSDYTDVFVRNDSVEVILNNGESVFGEIINGQWAIDYNEQLKLEVKSSMYGWDSKTITINPEDIKDVHIIKFNSQPKVYSNLNLLRYKKGLNGEVIQLDGYILKDKDSDGIKFYFPDSPGLGKDIGILSDVNELEDALKSTLVDKYGFTNTDFNINFTLGDDVVSRRNNQLIKSCTVELISGADEGIEDIEGLVQYLTSYEHAQNYLNRLLHKVLPSNIVTTRNNRALCSRLNFVRKYTFANLDELDDYVRTLLPDWMKNIGLFSVGYAKVINPTQAEDEVFENDMRVDLYDGVSSTAALQLINEYIKRYHGKFTFEIALAISNKAQQEFLTALFKVYPEIEDKLTNHIVNQ